MIMMKGAFCFFMSLAIGYVLCILGNKQKKGLLQTTGYALGIGIITMSLLYGVLDGNTMCKKGKVWCGNKMMKSNAGTFPKGQIK